MNHFPVQLKLNGFILQEIKKFLVNVCTHIDEVELVSLVLIPHTLSTNSLLIIEAEKL